MRLLLVKTVAFWLLHRPKVPNFSYSVKSSFLLKAALFSSLISKIEYLTMTVITLGQANTSVADMYARGNTLL